MGRIQIKKAALTVASVLTLILTASCPKTVSPPPLPPPPDQVAAPTISFFADPTTISNGQTAVLHWSVKDATSIQIDNQLGVVGPEGNREIHPALTTTYILEASGNGRTNTASVTVSVLSPPAAAHDNAQQSAGMIDRPTKEAFPSQMRDVHFAYGEHQVITQDQAVLENDARFLKAFFDFDKDHALAVVIEGHCDDRGSAEYNIGLGDRRANAIKESLIRLGVPATKLDTVSYGKEHPLCFATSEECFAQNRRVHFSIAQ